MARTSYMRALLDRMDEDRRVVDDYRQRQDVNPFETPGEDGESPIEGLKKLAENLWRQFNQRRQAESDQLRREPEEDLSIQPWEQIKQGGRFVPYGSRHLYAQPEELTRVPEGPPEFPDIPKWASSPVGELRGEGNPPYETFKTEYFARAGAPELLLRNPSTLRPSEEHQWSRLYPEWDARAMTAYDTQYGEGEAVKAKAREVPRRVTSIAGIGQGLGNIASNIMEPQLGIGATTPMDILFGAVDVAVGAPLVKKGVETGIQAGKKIAPELAQAGKMALADETGLLNYTRPFNEVAKSRTDYIKRVKGKTTEDFVIMPDEDAGAAKWRIIDLEADETGHVFDLGGASSEKQARALLDEYLAEAKKLPDAPLAKAEAGMPEAGMQSNIFGEPAKEVRPKGKGEVVQESMDDYAKLKRLENQSESENLAQRAWELDGEIEALEATKSEAGRLNRILPIWRNMQKRDDVSQGLTIEKYRQFTGRNQPNPKSLTPDGKHVRWEYTMDQIANDLGYEGTNELADALEKYDKAMKRLAEARVERAELKAEIGKAKSIVEPPKVTEPVVKAETVPIAELFHGTSIRSSQSLLKSQAFDMSKFGTGADIRFKKGTVGVFGVGAKPGFYGEGAYFTSSPELARIYAEARPSGKGKILRARVEGKIFDASDKSVVMDDLREYWVAKVKEAREIKRLSPISDNQLRVAFDAEVGGYQSGFIEAVNKYAKDKGFVGTRFSDSEIVIWDTKAIKTIRDIEKDVLNKVPEPQVPLPKAETETLIREAKPAAEGEVVKPTKEPWEMTVREWTAKERAKPTQYASQTPEGGWQSWLPSEPLAAPSTVTAPKGEYYYHYTGLEALEGIKKKGLGADAINTSRGQYLQAETKGRVYAVSEATPEFFENAIERDSQGIADWVILRFKSSGKRWHPDPEFKEAADAGKAFFATTPLSSDRIEILTKRGWRPLKEIAIRETGEHELMIYKALSEGKPVPAEVLNDYPDLVKSPKQKAEIPTEAKPVAEVPKVETLPTQAGGEIPPTKTPVPAATGGTTPPPGTPPPTTADAPSPALSSGGFLMADLQPAEQAAGIAFKPDKYRSIANLPGVQKIINILNPAAVAKDPAKQGVVLRYVLRDEVEQKTAGVMSHVWEKGGQEKIFGKLDDSGLLAEGILKGESLNQIRTYPKRYADKLTDAQKEWIERLHDVEVAKRDFAKRNGIEINELSFEEGGEYAGRRVMGKVDSDGNLIETAFIGAGPGKPGAKTSAEKSRYFKDIKEGVAAGFRYMPEDEALYFNVKGMGNRVADKQMADWVLNKVPWRTTGAPEELVLAAEQAKNKLRSAQRFLGAINRAVRGERVPDSTLQGVDQFYPEGAIALRRQLDRIAAGNQPTAQVVQQLTSDAKSALVDAQNGYEKAVNARMQARVAAIVPKYNEATVRAPAFAGKILTGNNAKETARILNEAFEPNYLSALENVKKLNAVSRFFALAGDASVFGIQLIMLPAFRPKVFARSAKGFVQAFFDPEFGYSVLRKGKDVIDTSPNMLVSTGGHTEFTEAFARNGLLNPHAYRPVGEGMAKSVAMAVPRTISKAGKVVLEPFQRAFETALDVAGIELKKSLRHMAKTPDEVAQLDQFINEFRGITSSARIGVSLNQRSVESFAMLAPRYNRAIGGILLDIGHGDLRGKLARQAIGSLITSAAAMTVAIDLARGKGVDEITSHLNPASPDFMTWDVAGQKVGPGSKVRSLIRLGGQIQQKIVDGKAGDLIELSMANPLARFFRGNLSPVASTSIDVVTGKNYIGEPTRDGVLSFSKSVLAENLIPIWVQGVLFQGGDLSQRILRGGVEFVGGRTYPDPELERVGKALGKVSNLGQTDTENLQKKIETAKTPEMKDYLRGKGDIYSTSDLATELKSATKYMTLDDMPQGKFPPIVYAYKQAEALFDKYDGIPPTKRKDYRKENPSVDAALFFWGKAESLQSDEAEEMVRTMIAQYGIPEKAVRGLNKPEPTKTPTLKAPAGLGSYGGYGGLKAPAGGLKRRTANPFGSKRPIFSR